MKKQLLLSLILALTLWASAEASDIAIQVQPQQDAPVYIVNCFLAKQSVQIARGVSVEGLYTGIVFRNNSLKTIATITFRFAMIDGSGALLETRFKESTGIFSPGVIIDNIHWLDVNSWPTLGAMSCSIGHVSFQNGSVWDAQP